MNAYLRKIVEETSIDINLQRIIGQNLCKINKHFMQFPFKRDYNCIDHPIRDKSIYHKNLSNFFPMYLDTHLGNTLWEDNMPYKTFLNPPINAIFVEAYKDLPKEDNYLIKFYFFVFKVFSLFWA